MAADDRSSLRQSHQRVHDHRAREISGGRERPARGGDGFGRWSAAHPLEAIRADPNIMALPDFEPLPSKLKGSVLLRLGDNISTDDIQPAGIYLPLRSNVKE